MNTWENTIRNCENTVQQYRQQHTQIKKQYTQQYNKINQDDISNLISNPNYIVFTCLLVEYKHYINKIEKNCQIMLFLNSQELKIFKLDRKSVYNYNIG